ATASLRASVQRDGFADERFERRGVDAVTFVKINRATHVALEARVEELGRIFQLGAFGERDLDDAFVGFAGADHAVVIPRWHASPLPLFGHAGIGLFDQGANLREGLAAPVAKLVDPRVDQLRRRFLGRGFGLRALLHALHVLVLIFGPRTAWRTPRAAA